MRIRIALSDYLNAIPLGWSFLHGPLRKQFEVLAAPPAYCADRLAAGAADIGMIPSIEYQRIPGLRIIPGMSVACSTQVRSVLMVRHKDRHVRSVAVDTSSRTSVVLLKLLLRVKMGLNPIFVPHPPDLKKMLEACDAALLIGDAALQISPQDYESLDLAEAWIKWQERPFVFAFWACRSEARLPDNIAEVFQEAKKSGLGARPEIIADYSRKLNLSPLFLDEYLSRNIEYDLGGAHIEGLESFYRLAYAADLIPGLQTVRFLPVRSEINAPVT